VSSGSGVDLIFQFLLEGGSDGIKRCRKMKRGQRTHLGSMERKCDTTWWNGDVGRRRAPPGRGKGGDDASWPDVNLTEPKNKENTRGRFSCYNWTVKI
jgi:hypothetical protein